MKKISADGNDKNKYKLQQLISWHESFDCGLIRSTFEALKKENQTALLGIPSIVLMAAAHNKHITPQLFSYDLSRIYNRTNLGIPPNEAIKLYNSAIKAKCFDNIPQELRDDFKEELEKRTNIDYLGEEIKKGPQVWVPLVDEKTKMIWFDRFLPEQNESFLKSKEYIKLEGDSYKFGSIVAECINKHSDANIKLVVTGDFNLDTKSVCKVSQESFELKVKAAIAFGADYVMGPAENFKKNFEQSSYCKNNKDKIRAYLTLGELTTSMSEFMKRSSENEKRHQLISRQDVDIKKEIRKARIKEEFTAKHDEARTYFIETHYKKALSAYDKLTENTDFKQYLRENERDYLIIKLNQIKCLFDAFNTKSFKKERFENELQTYLEHFEPSKCDLSHAPAKDFFEMYVKFFISTKTSFCRAFDKISHCHNILAQKTLTDNKKLFTKPEQLFEIWLDELEENKYAFIEKGLANQLERHCDSLLNRFELNPKHKLRLLRLIAEILLLSGACAKAGKSQGDLNKYLKMIKELSPKDTLLQFKPLSAP